MRILHYQTCFSWSDFLTIKEQKNVNYSSCLPPTDLTFGLLLGYEDERSVLMSQRKLEKRFGQSPIFIASTFMTQGGIPPSTNPASLLKEAIHVISCGYEDKTEWGKEVSVASKVSLFLSFIDLFNFVSWHRISFPVPGLRT